MDWNEKYEEISVSELKALIDCGKNLIVLDVREPFEINIAKMDDTVNIPMREVEQRIRELNPKEEIIVLCKSGARSAKICNLLIDHNFENVKNLRGGILAWSKEIDSSIPTY